jgi:DNA-binding response OmpR family regulator
VPGRNPFHKCSWEALAWPSRRGLASWDLDLLKRVRADERFKKTPFLLVTAESEQSQVIDAVKSGVDQYVVKPFTKEDLMKKLEAAHKKYAAKG